MHAGGFAGDRGFRDARRGGIPPLQGIIPKLFTDLRPTKPCQLVGILARAAEVDTVVSDVVLSLEARFE